MESHQLLQEINISAQRTSAVLYRLIDLPEVRHNPYTARLLKLILELKTCSQEAIIAYSEGDRQGYKSYLEILFRSETMASELNTMLGRTTPKVPKKIKGKLDRDINNLENLLVRLARAISVIFGPRETLYILTPKYQDLANLW